MERLVSLGTSWPSCSKEDQTKHEVPRRAYIYTTATSFEKERYLRIAKHIPTLSFHLNIPPISNPFRRLKSPRPIASDGIMSSICRHRSKPITHARSLNRQPPVSTSQQSHSKACMIHHINPIYTSRKPTIPHREKAMIPLVRQEQPESIRRSGAGDDMDLNSTQSSELRRTDWICDVRCGHWKGRILREVKCGYNRRGGGK